MDISIRSNYKDISFSFSFKIWEVSSAVHISSGVEVSIWKFNKELINDDNKKYNDLEIDSFLAKYRISLTALQHIRHQNILRIYEISEIGANPFCFSSERISSAFSRESNFTTDESFFIASQLAEALQYLHKDLKVAHLAICPDSILFSPRFDLKLGNLVHFAKISDLKSPCSEPNLYPIDTSIFDTDPDYVSPEIKERKSLTSFSDVYSFGLLCIKAFLNELPKQQQFPIGIDTFVKLPEDISKLIQRCLSLDIEQRLSFEQIVELAVFSPVKVRVLDFITLISENPIESRQTFYKNLSGMISEFSPRLLSRRLIPVLVKEVKENNIFEKQLLPIILAAAEKINSASFENEVLMPLFDNESIANFFIDQAIMFTNASLYLPILLSTINSPNSEINSRGPELLKTFNAIDDPEAIIPLLGKIDDKAILISILAVFDDKVQDEDTFSFITQLKNIFKKFADDAQICTTVANSLTSLEPNKENAKPAVSLSFLIIESQLLPSEVKQRSLNFMAQCVLAVGESQNLDITSLGIDKKKKKKRRKKAQSSSKSSSDPFGINEFDPFDVKKAPINHPNPFANNGIDPFSVPSKTITAILDKDPFEVPLSLKKIKISLIEDGEPKNVENLSPFPNVQAAVKFPGTDIDPFKIPQTANNTLNTTSANTIMNNSDNSNIGISSDEGPFKVQSKKNIDMNPVFQPPDQNGKPVPLSPSRSPKPPLPEEIKHHHRTRSKNASDFLNLGAKKRHKKGKDAISRSSIPASAVHFETPEQNVGIPLQLHRNTSFDVFKNTTKPPGLPDINKPSQSKYNIPAPPKKKRSKSKAYLDFAEFNFAED